MTDKIIIIGYVYESKQNGGVIDDSGVCYCLGVGCHGGVEVKIKIVYET